MLTRKQKSQKRSENKKLMDENRSLVFIDFNGKSVGEMEGLRRKLGELGAKLKVIKKKLLRIAFSEKKIEFDPEQFETQLGTIFAPSEMHEIAGPVYKSGLKMIGGYDLQAKSVLDEKQMKVLGQLPSKEVLLGQLVGMLAAPIRMFLYVLDQKSKQMVEK